MDIKLIALTEETALGMFGTLDTMELTDHDLVLATLTFDFLEDLESVLNDIFHAVSNLPEGKRFKVYSIPTSGDFTFHVIVDADSAAEFSD